MATYLLDVEYNRLVGTLKSVAPILRIKPSGWTGTITENEIKLALGEKLDIWPASVIDDLDDEEEDSSES